MLFDVYVVEFNLTLTVVFKCIVVIVIGLINRVPVGWILNFGGIVQFAGNG